MEAKDKAKALVSEYYFLLSRLSIEFIEENWESISLAPKDNYFLKAKQCALIACAEVKENGFNPQLPYNFWEDVEQEINQL